MKTAIKRSPKIISGNTGTPAQKKQVDPDLADAEKWTLKRILLAVVCAFFFPLIYWIGKNITAWLG